MTVLALRHGGGQREVRLFDTVGLRAPAPGSWEARALLAGYDVDGLSVAAVGAAVRLVSETVASFVMRVYTGDASKKTVLLDDPVAELFQYPSLDGDRDSFQLWQDVATACEIGKGAAIFKARDRRRRVAELYVLDPRTVKAERNAAGETRVLVRRNLAGDWRDITSDTVWIRGWAPNPNPEGVSTLDLHAQGLQTAWAYEVYRAAYFENGGLPSVVIQHPGNPVKEKRDEMLDGWERRHSRARNNGRPGMIWGGATVLPITPNLRDSQTAEIADTIVRDVARMFRIVPAELLATTLASSSLPQPEHAADLFVRFTLLSRLRRIERALASDPDLFPDRARYPLFDMSNFLRGDLATRATVVHMLRQDGVMTGNEGRAEFGLEPMDGADELQQTPVGGAPGAAGTPGAITDGTSPA